MICLILESLISLFSGWNLDEWHNLEDGCRLLGIPLSWVAEHNPTQAPLSGLCENHGVVVFDQQNFLFGTDQYKVRSVKLEDMIKLFSIPQL